MSKEDEVTEDEEDGGEEGEGVYSKEISREGLRLRLKDTPE